MSAARLAPLGRSIALALLVAFACATGAAWAKPADSAAADEPGQRSTPAAAAASARHPGDVLTVYMLTMGPGSHPFFKFGHNAIWIHDAGRRTDYVYNYGTFHFGSVALIPKFFLGRFLYSLSRSTIRSTERNYRRENRSLVAQELELTPQQRVELRDFLEWNRRKENRYYRYDYYRDNCSTRVRDAIDRLVGGRIHQAAASPASMTYRAHTLRLTADLLPEYVILLLVLGDLVDQPIDRWQETFLPEKLYELMKEVKVPGPDGDVPLVRGEKVLLRADRPEPLSEPPSWAVWFALVGVGVGGVLAWTGRAGRSSRLARVLGGVVGGLFGFVLGFFGTFFCLLWALTDHEVAYRNENILQCAPWLLAIPVLAVGAARLNPKSSDRAWRAWRAAAVASGLGLLLKALPWFDQYNGQIIAFALPTTLGGALGARWLHLAAVADSSRRPAGEAAKPAGEAAKPAAPATPPPADTHDETQGEPSSDPEPRP